MIINNDNKYAIFMIVNLSVYLPKEAEGNGWRDCDIGVGIPQKQRHISINNKRNNLSYRCQRQWWCRPGERRICRPARGPAG